MKKLLYFLFGVLITLETILLIIIITNSQVWRDFFRSNLNVPKFESIESANEWCYNNIEYISDIDSTGYDEYFKTPEETLQSQNGDCDDYAILLLSIVKQQFDIYGKFYTVKTAEGYHAIVSFGDEFYDPTNNYTGFKEYYLSISVIYDYNEIMNMTYKGYKWKYEK